MKKFIITAITLFAISACGSNTLVKNQLNFGPNAGTVKYKVGNITHDKVKRNVDHKITARIRQQLTEILQQRNLLGSEYTVNIDILEYRVKNGALRFFTGAMSGQEFITSEVNVVDSSGESVGSAKINTYNTTALNVLAAEHAKEISQFLTKQ